jgi:uridine kinase
MSLIIGIAGPSCSGKSSICKVLLDELPDAECLSLDDFFVERGEYPKYEDFINMDSPEGIKFDSFFKALKQIKESQPVEVPTYDTFASRRIGTRTVYPRNLILCEGFLLFYDLRIREMFDEKIYLDLQVEIQRKRKEARGRYWDSLYFDRVLIPMFEKYGKVARYYSDHIIDASRGFQDVLNDMRKIIRLVEKNA